jgi:SAM-dependent methyltransferase
MKDSPSGPESDQRRKASEAAFHDVRYQDDPRRGLSVFYQATRDSRDEFLRQLQEIPVGASVLELGCGPSPNSLALAGRGCQCTAIDISSEAVEQTRRQAAELGVRIRTAVTDAENSGLPPASFDYVIGNGIVHHLDIGSVARELDRLLVPTGTAIFVEPLGMNPLINGFRRVTPSLRTDDEHPLKPNDLRLLEADGVFTCSARFYTLTQLIPSVAVWLTPRLGFTQVVAPGLQRLDQAILDGRSPLRWLAWMTVITMQRPSRGSA